MTWSFGFLIGIFVVSLIAPELRWRRRRIVGPKELGQLIASGRAKTKAATRNGPLPRRGGGTVDAYHRSSR